MAEIIIFEAGLCKSVFGCFLCVLLLFRPTVTLHILVHWQPVKSLTKSIGTAVNILQFLIFNKLILHE